MDWGLGQGIKSHHTQTCQGVLATVVIRGVLTWAKEKEELDCCPVVQSPLLRMLRASFVFHWNQGPRVWRKVGEEVHCLSFQSLGWFGVQCNLLVLVHCVFGKLTSLHPFIKKFWSTSCSFFADQLFKDADFIFQQDWHLPTLPKVG